MCSLNLRKFLENIIDNWPAKVLSVALAIILFMFHRMSALEERYFSVPLHVETDGTLVPASSYPRMVRITLRGEANSIYPIADDDIEPYIDLTKYKGEGVFKVAVQVRKKGTAAGIDPLEIYVEPLEIAVAVERKLSKTVPVTPSFRGYLESGYELSAYQLDPPQVEISGPTSLVSRINDVTTDFIELSGRKEDFAAVVKIQNRDPLLTVQGRSTVEFTAQVQQSIMIKSFDRLPIVISGLSERFVARPQINFGNIRLQGSQNELEVYIPDASLLSLDCSDVDGEGVYLLPLIVSAPQHLSVVRYDPVEIAVEIVARDRLP